MSEIKSSSVSSCFDCPILVLDIWSWLKQDPTWLNMTSDMSGAMTSVFKSLLCSAEIKLDFLLPELLLWWTIKSVLKDWRKLKSTIESWECDGAIKSGFPCNVVDNDFGMIGLKKIIILVSFASFDTLFEIFIICLKKIQLWFFLVKNSWKCGGFGLF